MIIDPAVIPGLLLVVAELAALAAVGYVIARVVLRQDDERMALAQGLVVGPALWGVIVNFVLYVVPGMAGAALGWGVILPLAAVLAWRAPQPTRPRPRTVAGFAAVMLVLVWAALASRQLFGNPDPHSQLGLAASIRAGAFPPELFWNPGSPAPYHHGIPLLVGLLTPPVGPDLAFVTELLGAYVWTSFALIVIAALLQRASLIAVLVTVPLLLGPGIRTFSRSKPGILQLPIPAGPVDGDLGASLGDIYWPAVDLGPNLLHYELMVDLFRPAFPLGYAVALVVLAYAVRSERWSWGASATLAGLVGFLGMLAPTIVPGVVVVWVGLAAWHFMRGRRAESVARAALRSSAGLVLAGLVLLGTGGVFTRMLDGAPSSGLELARSLDPRYTHALVAFYPQPGGVGLLGLGPLAVAGVAAVLARRDRLVLALAAGAGFLVVAWLALNYPPYPLDLERLAGHARNFALVALLLALSARLSSLRSVRWRYALGVLLVGLIIWPSIAGSVRGLGLTVGNGVQLANANWVREEFFDQGVAIPPWRSRLRPLPGRVADYVRDHTPVDARVLATRTPYWNVSFATGRPTNGGFDGLTHLFYHQGPEYLDAVNLLEPAAIRRLGIEYVHATDAWVNTLPQRAQAWLADPQLFELLIRDEHERLYRVRRAFLGLDVSPNPRSFEALQQAVPPSATVYFVVPPRAIETLRVASTLSHARLVGRVDTHELHLLTPTSWRVEPLTDETPDIVVLPSSAETWMFPPSARTPIWSNNNVAVYAPTGAVPRIVNAPMPGRPVSGDPPPVQMQVTHVSEADGRIEFVAAFDERAPQGWTGQDWILLKSDRSPWAIPTAIYRRDEDRTIAGWFAGWLSAGGGTTFETFRFDGRVPELSVRNNHGDFLPLASSAAGLGPGSYTLALRLRHEYEPGRWRDAAVIPVLRMGISEGGEVTYQPSTGILGRLPS